MSPQRVKTVAVIGATHGNEKGGAHLAHLFAQTTGPSPTWHLPFKQDPNTPSLGWSSLEVTGVLANIEAYDRCVRYVDEDLNRCFSAERLNSPKTTTSTHEGRIAQQINQAIGPKRGTAGEGVEPKTDMAFDLHNTASNTGVLLCFHQNDPLALELAAYLHLKSPNTTISASLWDTVDAPYLPTIAKSGMTIEVGPVAHGTVDARVVAEVVRLLTLSLSYLHLRNQAGANAKRIKHFIPVGKRVAQVDYPRKPASDAGKATIPAPVASNPRTWELAGFVHGDLQGLKEHGPDSYLKENQPMFVDASGAVVKRFRQADYPDANGQKLYPLFVNEPAYEEKGVAFFLNRLDTMEVQVLDDGASPSRL